MLTAAVRAAIPVAGLCVSLLAPCLARGGSADDAFASARQAQLAAARKDRPAAWRKAADDFAAFVAAHPDHRLTTEALFGLAECALAAGEPDRAADAYARVRERGAGRREGDLLGGEAFVLLTQMQADEREDVGRREAFLDRVAELRRLDAGHERLRSLLWFAAHVYRRTGRAEQADDALLALVGRWPDDPVVSADAWDDLGALRVEQGDWEGAVRAYRGYLDHVVDGARESEIRCLLAYAHLQLGEPHDAAVAAERLLGELAPERRAADRRLWTETVKILAQARHGELDSPSKIRQFVERADHPWSLDLALAALAVWAGGGSPQLALDGLDLLRGMQRLELERAAETTRSLLVDVCLTLREVLPDDEAVQVWLLEAAAAMDSLDRTGDAGELLQWLRTHAVDPSIRREARERQLRVD